VTILIFCRINQKASV